MTPFPWTRAMAFGLGVLKLPPAEFWSMSPRELAAALQGASGGNGGGPAPSRGALAELMARFPDASASGPAR